MSEKRRQPRKPSRREKEQAAEQHASTPAPMTGKKVDLTDEQTLVANLIKSKDLAFVQGSAGSGKTFGILAEFVSEYLSDKSKTIIVIRTPVEAGSDKIGFLPNEYADKIAPHFQSTRDALNTLLGKGKVDCDMDHRIFFKIPNYALGSTWDNALVLIDEAQQMQPMIMKLLLERAGINTKVVVAGDPSQLYTTDRTRNGLTHAMDHFIDANGEPFYPNVGHYKFSLEASKTRSELAYTVVHAYNQNR